MTNEEKRKNEISFKLISALRKARETVDKAIDEVKAQLWLPREYEAKFDHYDLDRGEAPIVPSSDGLIVPDVRTFVVFGADYAEPGTEWPGLPEVARRHFGIERIFDPERLSIDDDDAPHFAIEGFSIGNRAVIPMYSHSIPATRFAASAERIELNYYADAGAQIVLIVRNTSAEPRQFRAKLIGIEQPAV